MPPYWITESARKIAIVPRPRGGDWIAEDARVLRAEGIDVLASMLTPPESLELGLVGEEEAMTDAGIVFRAHAIPDRCVPASTREFVGFLAQLQRDSKEGKSIGVHCRAGIGRSSLAVGALLCLDGTSVDTALSQIAKARGRPVPDTEEQREWLNRLFTS